ncbi:MAG: peptidylprolyl isomerase [Oscillospiraceae bacterium]|nr:peptidylprolyl isomerase [Oscillospiraceae bacterium]
MSASRERRKRLEQQALEASSPKRSGRNSEERKRKIVKNTIISAVSLGILYLVVLGTGFFHATLPALIVGNVRISAAEFNYHYFSRVFSEYQQYSQQEQQPFDLAQPLDRQQQTEDMSWGDYFEDAVIEDLTEIVIQSEAAKKEGIGLTEEDIEAIDANIKNLADSAGEQNVPAERLLQSNFDRGITIDSYRSFLERAALSERYKTVTMEGYERSDEDIAKHFEDNINDYEYVDYHHYTFPAVYDPSQDEAAGQTAEGTSSLEGHDPEKHPELKAQEDDAKEKEEAYKKEVKAEADKMLKEITGAENFFTVSKAYEPTPEPIPEELDEEGNPVVVPEPGEAGAIDEEEEIDATLAEKTLLSGLSEPMLKYLGDPKRKPGDKSVIEDGDGFAVVLFLNRYREEEKYVNVRHIRVALEAEKVEEEDNEKTEVSAEVKEASKRLAEEILAEWNAGAATSESFAKLAEEKTDDPGSASTGGLYTDITSQSSYVENFLNWCLDESNKVGDTGIVETEFGYHIMYKDKINKNSGEDEEDSVDVRHILVSFDRENPEETEAKKAASKKLAEELLAAWRAGDATSESFAALAKEKSENDTTGLISDGGLSNDVNSEALESASEEFEGFLNWVLDEGNKAGDTAILEIGNDSFYIVYKEKIQEPRWRELVKNDMNTEEYDSHFSDLEDDLTQEPKKQPGIVFTKSGRVFF